MPLRSHAISVSLSQLVIVIAVIRAMMVMLMLDRIFFIIVVFNCYYSLFAPSFVCKSTEKTRNMIEKNPTMA